MSAQWHCDWPGCTAQEPPERAGWVSLWHRSEDYAPTFRASVTGHAKHICPSHTKAIFWEFYRAVAVARGTPPEGEPGA